MDLTWSLDDIARTSEDAAVRQRFARRNRVYLLVLLVCFTVVSIVEVASHNRQTTPFDNLLGAFNLALTSFGLFFLRYAYGTRDAAAGFMWRAGAWLRAHISAVALGFVAIQYALGLTYTRHGDDWSGWVMTSRSSSSAFGCSCPSSCSCTPSFSAADSDDGQSRSGRSRVPVYSEGADNAMGRVNLDSDGAKSHKDELAARPKNRCKMVTQMIDLRGRPMVME